MALIEHESEERLTREQAAGRLRELADQLARHNEVAFEKGGIPVRVDVADEVTFSLEIEIGDKNEIEIEIKW